MTTLNANDIARILGNSVPTPSPPKTAPTTVHQYHDFVLAIEAIVKENDADTSDNWYLVYAAAMEQLCKIPISEIIINYNDYVRAQTQQETLREWYAKNKTGKMIKDAVRVFRNLDSMNTRLDRMIYEIYRYNFDQAEKDILKFEKYIQTETQEMERSLTEASETSDTPTENLDYGEIYSSEHVDDSDETSSVHNFHFNTSMMRQRRMGAEIVHDIRCDPVAPNKRTKYTWDITCDEKPPPQLQNKIIWEIECESKGVPPLLLKEINDIKKMAEQFKVNNATSGNDFINNLKEFQKKLAEIAKLAWDYLHIPATFDYDLTLHKSQLNFVYKQFVNKMYLTLIQKAEQYNRALYDYLSKYNLEDLMTDLLTSLNVNNRSAAMVFIEYVCYSFNATSPNVNTKTIENNPNTTIYFNGNTTKKLNMNSANRSLHAFKTALESQQRMKNVVPAWVPP